MADMKGWLVWVVRFFPWAFVEHLLLS
jgi:hypothetical protein